MSVVISDLSCSYCSNGDCNYHIAKTTVIDKRTGLEVQVYCCCKNHKSFSNSNQPATGNPKKGAAHPC